MSIDCRIIGDLLPLYADDACSPESRALVEAHLASCPSCREALRRMQSEQLSPARVPLDPPQLTDYARAVKKRRKCRRVLLSLAAVFLVLLLSLTLAAWMNLVRAQHPYIPAVEELSLIHI